MEDENNEDDDEETPEEPSEDEDEDEEEMFPVEKILATRTIRRQVQYRVKWVGYDRPTWELASNIPDILIEEFNKNQNSD